MHPHSLEPLPAAAAARDRPTGAGLGVVERSSVERFRSMLEDSKRQLLASARRTQAGRAAIDDDDLADDFDLANAEYSQSLTSQLLEREKYALDEQGDVLARLRHELPELLDGVDPGAIHRQDHVAGPDPSARGRPLDVLHQDAAAHAGPLALVGRERAHRQAEPALLTLLMAALGGHRGRLRPGGGASSPRRARRGCHPGIAVVCPTSMR